MKLLVISVTKKNKIITKIDDANKEMFQMKLISLFDAWLL